MILNISRCKKNGKKLFNISQKQMKNSSFYKWKTLYFFLYLFIGKSSPKRFYFFYCKIQNFFINSTNVIYARVKSRL